MADARTIGLDNGRSLHALTAGKGADILLIHGAITTHRDWLGGPFEALARIGRVTAVDRPGHGLSARPRFEAGPRHQARQIRAAAERLGIERPLVVGHSFGGLVALAYAGLFPGEVRGLLLLAPIAFPEVRPLEQALFGLRAMPLAGPALAGLMTRSIDRPALEAVHELMFAPQAPPPGWKRNYPWNHVLAARQSVAEGEDSAAVHPLMAGEWIDFSRISVPVRLLAGTADRIVDPDRHARPLAEALPDARLHPVAGAGHMLHHSRTALVEAHVREALAPA